ncbi:MAG: Tim44-like domain protein [Caulobacteraceae bacterium]|nr:Tim44-like domain protein [Caulobacteraceae bacterium]
MRHSSVRLNTTMTSPRRFNRLVPILAIGLALSLGLAGAAEARRGGGFGSRGARTYQAPASTALAPRAAAPITRSMTPPPQAPSAARPGVAPQPQRPGFFNRFGGGLLGGLLLGGLIGGLMGHGFGFGGAGLLTMLIHLAVVDVAISLIMRLFRRPAPAGGGTPTASLFGVPAADPTRLVAPVPGYGAQGYAPPMAQIQINPQDTEAFERLLIEIQDAFAREDYAALRERTTPEVMSFLAEELSQNATQGRRNEVSGTRLLQQDLAEAWREPDADYATVAMRFESTDVMRDRQSGQVLDGNPQRPTQTTEIWTFARGLEGPWGGVWKLSAIQDA